MEDQLKRVAGFIGEALPTRRSKRCKNYEMSEEKGYLASLAQSFSFE